MSTSATATALALGYWPDWRDAAACRDTDPELFFPEEDTRVSRAQVKAAKLICRACPVSAICLGWALASGYEAGIWGGHTEEERRALRRRDRHRAGQRMNLGGDYDQYPE